MNASIHRIANRFRRGIASLRGDRGASLVEFGLVAPVFLALILGGVTTGLSYNSNNSLNNGARETARYAATLPVDGAIDAWLGQIADTAKLTTSGELNDTVPGQLICVAFVHPDGVDSGDSTKLLLEQNGSRQLLDGRTCFDDGRPASERRVQVVLGRDTEIQAIVYNKTIGLEARSVVRFERAG